MIPSDIYSVLQWWLVILVLGTGFLPLTFLVFKNFFDSGYIFSKVLAIAFTSYAIFLLGVLHILPFTKTFSWIIFILLISILLSFVFKKIKLILIIKQNWRIFIFEELLFLGALFFWAYIRGFAPDIHGLEKYMDFGFINSILRSDYFPPKDMWFTPDPINYYYFGHLATAVLTRLASLPANITFNLMLSTVFALCLAQTFSLGANLYGFMQKSAKFSNAKRIVSGLLTAILVSFAGNLHILYGFFKQYETDNPTPLWQLPLMLLSFPNSYWYPNATRFIYHTIHEFPIYSWVVADLHGHVLDIPFVLLTIAALLSFFIKEKPQKSKSEIENLLLVGFLLAVMYMTNAWDGGIYLLLSGLVILYINWQKPLSLIISMIIVVFSLVIFSLPYSYFFKPFASGIGIICAPDFLISMKKIGPLLFEPDHCQRSYWWQLLTLYGFFYFFVISFGIFMSRIKKPLKTDVFVFLLIALSTFLIILPEFIYLKDIYPTYFRANTMFKLVFQAFIILSISTGYIIVRIISSTKRKLFTVWYLLFSVCLISLVMSYPYLAIKSYYNDLKTHKSLDGTAYLKSLYPYDYAAIQWLNKNVLGQPVILEAQGDSYTDFARVSSNTGLPTVLGWTVHEWLWRGSYDIPAPRIDEVKKLYETTDAQIVKQLISKHKIEYVFIGNLEYQKYPNLSDLKFQKLGKIVYQNQTTKIYKISL